MTFPLHTTVFTSCFPCPLALYRALSAGRDSCILLESASLQGGSDTSFIAIGCRDRIIIQNGRVRGSRFVSDGPITDPLDIFRQFIGDRHPKGKLRMGYIGFLSYEAARFFLPITLSVDASFPDAYFVLPEVIIRMDHREKVITIVSHADTTEDLAALEATLVRCSRASEPSVDVSCTINPADFRRTPADVFLHSVESIQELIRAGEAFQVVLSQEFSLPAMDASLVYRMLRLLNPSPYMYLVRTPDFTIVGASPETLVRVQGDRILYRPIAGTRRRTGDESRDRESIADLQQSAKERAEHQMLVDLGRNDIGKVAAIGTVEVQNPFRIETYATLFHIVSDVGATLAPTATALDALRATFPLGTVTGAPKLRAMEIIRDFERCPRGMYGGAIGYIDLGGDIDFAIMLRTMLCTDHAISLRTGAGIVADSVPAHEDLECMNKARSCITAASLASSFPSLS